MLLKKSQLYIFSLIPFVVGVYQIFNDNFLSVYEWDSSTLGFIDDKAFGIFQILLAFVILMSAVTKNIGLQTTGLVVLGGTLFSIAFVYFRRLFDGDPNITWILAIAIFGWVMLSIAHKENENERPTDE